MSVLTAAALVDEETKRVLRRYLPNVNFGPGDPGPVVDGKAQQHAPLVIIENKGRSAVMRLLGSKPTEIGSVSYARRCLILDGQLASEPDLRGGIWEPTGVAQPLHYSELVKTDPLTGQPEAFRVPAAKWADWLDPQKDVRSLH